VTLYQHLRNSDVLKLVLPLILVHTMYITFGPYGYIKVWDLTYKLCPLQLTCDSYFFVV